MAILNSAQAALFKVRDEMTEFVQHTFTNLPPKQDPTQDSLQKAAQWTGRVLIVLGGVKALNVALGIIGLVALPLPASLAFVGSAVWLLSLAYAAGTVYKSIEPEVLQVVKGTFSERELAKAQEVANTAFRALAVAVLCGIVRF